MFGRTADAVVFLVSNNHGKMVTEANDNDNCNDVGSLTCCRAQCQVSRSYLMEL